MHQFVDAFAEDGTVIESGTYETYYDYVSGVNPYYRAFAERFEMPEGCDVEISSINFGSQNFYLFAETIGIGKDENGEEPWPYMAKRTASPTLPTHLAR